MSKQHFTNPRSRRLRRDGEAKIAREAKIADRHARHPLRGPAGPYAGPDVWPLRDGYAGHGSHRPGSVCLECERAS